MLFGSRSIPLNDENSEIQFKITIENENIAQVDSTQFLGVIVDQKLNWQKHIAYISLKISKSLNILNRVKYKLPKKSLISLYYSLVCLHLNYCIIVWGSAYNTALHRLIVLQKPAIRTINNSHYRNHTEPLFKSLSFLNLTMYMYSLVVCLSTNLKTNY